MNSVNIVNIANIVNFNAMRYKKQYNDSSHVLVSRQTGNSIEKTTSLLFIFQTITAGTMNVFETLSASKKEKNDMRLTKK